MNYKPVSNRTIMEAYDYQDYLMMDDMLDMARADSLNRAMNELYNVELLVRKTLEEYKAKGKRADKDFNLTQYRCYDSELSAIIVASIKVQRIGEKVEGYKMPEPAKKLDFMIKAGKMAKTKRIWSIRERKELEMNMRRLGKHSEYWILGKGYLKPKLYGAIIKRNKAMKRDCITIVLCPIKARRDDRVLPKLIKSGDRQ